MELPPFPAVFATPRVVVRGRRWSSDEVDAIARRLHAAAIDAVGERAPLVVAVIPPSVEGIAVLLAASALTGTVVLLPPEPRAWVSDPALPIGTDFLLSSSCAHLAGEVERIKGRPRILDAEPYADARPIALMQAAGMVWFTSGSTGYPKPVFRPAASILACVDQRLATLPLEPGTGVVSGDSLARGQGLVEFLLSCRLNGTFAPLEATNLRATLAVLRQPEFGVWFTTPQVAELLSRCALDGPPVVPPLCFVAGVVSRRTAAAFTVRFGRPLRQHYGSSEAGPVSLEGSEDAAIRPGSVGRRVHGVEIRIGDTSETPLRHDEIGRIWIRSAGQMAGYGFPPHLDRSDIIDGWWPTSDLGELSEDGYLTLAGRIDDCIRVRDGRLVNLATVATRLREVAGITDAVVLPVEGAAGLTFGAVFEGATPPEVARQALSVEVPPWCLPRGLVALSALPRLSNGKVDREACRRLLAGAQSA